jgi:glycosyltransferase involved in cell wall biosynthesis
MKPEISVGQSVFLTIGIPTWNRCTCLQRNLPYLITEVAKIRNINVEIFVSDNASTDDTELLCRNLSAQHPCVRYHRNTSNLGPNANFDIVMRKSLGRYVWLLGDDDRIMEDSLPRIISDIHAHNFPTVVVGGYRLLDTGRSAFLDKLTTPLHTDYRVFADYNAVHLAGKISVLIFRRDRVEPILDEAWPLVNTTRTPWPHLLWLMLTLARGGSVLVLPYSVTGEIEEDRYNLLWDGVTRARTVFNDYEACIRLIQAQLSPAQHRLLMESVTRGRGGEMLRLAALSGYLNSYWENLRYAWKTVLYFQSWENKARFMLYYLLPSILPNVARKGFAFLLAILLYGPTRYQRALEHVLTYKSHLGKTGREQKRRIHTGADL